MYSCQFLLLGDDTHMTSSNLCLLVVTWLIVQIYTIILGELLPSDPADDAAVSHTAHHGARFAAGEMSMVL